MCKHTFTHVHLYVYHYIYMYIYTKLQSCPSNPAFECTVYPKYQELFARKESAILTFGIRIKAVLENSDISNDNVHQTIISEIPPWTLNRPRVNLELSSLSKKDTPSVFIQKFNEIKNEHSYCTPIYTDGSKDNDRVGCGTIIDNSSFKQRLPLPFLLLKLQQLT